MWKSIVNKWDRFWRRTLTWNKIMDKNREDESVIF